MSVSLLHLTDSSEAQLLWIWGLFKVCILYFEMDLDIFLSALSLLPEVWWDQKAEAGPSFRFAQHQTRCSRILWTPVKNKHSFHDGWILFWSPHLSRLLPDTPERILVRDLPPQRVLRLPLKAAAHSPLSKGLASLNLNLHKIFNVRVGSNKAFNQFNQNPPESPISSPRNRRCLP